MAVPSFWTRAVCNSFLLLLLSTNANQICDFSAWEIRGGDWLHNSTDCTLQNSNPGDGYFSAAVRSPCSFDGSFLTTVHLAVHSGHSAGILFRFEDADAPYYVGLDVVENQMQYGALTGDGISLKGLPLSTLDSPVTLSYDTIYRVRVYADSGVYSVWFDDQFMVNALAHSTLHSTTSIEVVTSHSHTTYHELTCSKDATFNDGTNAVSCTEVTSSSAHCAQSNIKFRVLMWNQGMFPLLRLWRKAVDCSQASPQRAPPTQVHGVTVGMYTLNLRSSQNIHISSSGHY